MLEVIVANEFRQINAAGERRPFKVLTPPGRESAMVIARYSNQATGSRTEADAPFQPPDLVWKAVRLGSICAAGAFAFFFLSQRHLFEQTAGQSVRPPADAIQRVHFSAVPATQQQQEPTPPSLIPPVDAKTISAPTEEPQKFALPEASNIAVTEFNLTITPGFQNVGKVEMRLMGVNTAARTYDIAVRTGRREFYRQDVQLDEPIPLAKSDDGPELVVGAMEQNRVFGYVSEPLHRGHRRHHRRK